MFFAVEKGDVSVWSSIMTEDRRYFAVCQSYDEQQFVNEEKYKEYSSFVFPGEISLIPREGKEWDWALKTNLPNGMYLFLDTGEIIQVHDHNIRDDLWLCPILEYLCWNKRGKYDDMFPSEKELKEKGFELTFVEVNSKDGSR